MTEFPDRNLDVLHQRVASGAPTVDQQALKLGRLVLVAEGLLRSHGTGTATIVLDEAGDWHVVTDVGGHANTSYGSSLREALERNLVYPSGTSRPHVAAQEDDGDTD